MQGSDFVSSAFSSSVGLAAARRDDGGACVRDVRSVGCAVGGGCAATRTGRDEYWTALGL